MAKAAMTEMQQRIEAVRRDAFAAGYASDPGSRVALGAQGWNQCLMCGRPLWRKRVIQ